MRWDSASSADGGRAWTTDWIMEFSRTRAADEVTRDRLFDHAWTEGDVSPHAEARALDFLVGSWEGLQSGGPRVLEARLDARTVNKGCLVVDELRTRPGRTHEGQEPWRARFAVRGWVPRGDGHFESWSVASDDTVLRRATGAVDGDGAVFDTTYRETGAVMREAWVRVSPDELHVTESRRLTADDEFRQLRVTKLKRVE